MILQLLSILFLVPALFACLYYIFFLLIYFLRRKDRSTDTGFTSKHSFAIVVPAHDEEQVITELLKSCEAIDYPLDLFEVIVIADNCSDNTARVVKRFGNKCLERSNKQLKGKGHALEWGLSHISLQNFDAVLIIDADCNIESWALKVFDLYLQKGFGILQANFQTLNADVNTMTFMAALGNFFENSLYYAPKSKLGMPVALQGTGMVIMASILQDFPWKTASVSEDIEYGLKLLRVEKYVKFIPEVHVGVKAPENHHQLKVQRSRWAEGTLSLGKTYGLKMMFEGVVKRKFFLIDAGWSLLVISRPMLIVHFFTTLVLILFSLWGNPGLLSDILLFMATGIFCLYIVYLLTGFWAFGVTPGRIKFFISMPIVILKLILITLLGLRGAGNVIWLKTPRL